jgi:uncharacterized iron-regulated protein
MVRRVLLPLALLLAVSPVVRGQQPSYVPNRVLDAPRGQFSDFETMVADLARADVVFLGEQHDDPNTHRLQLAVLEGLARRSDGSSRSRCSSATSGEPLEHFIMGHSTEEEFLAAARPWPRY